MPIVKAMVSGDYRTPEVTERITDFSSTDAVDLVLARGLSIIMGECLCQRFSRWECPPPDESCDAAYKSAYNNGKWPSKPGLLLARTKLLLGSGGMGEVYRARDTRLQRDVALKLLPDLFASDSDRLARFQREAVVLASLNHPNIAAIYGLEESQPAPALVMELVDGPTLAEWIAQGPIPIEEVLKIARQLAEALEYAHESGIIHRDLKPANIKCTVDGRVKILDFGLAKALGDNPGTTTMSNSPTLSLAATQAGIILGTAGYMSPEQAKGKTADRRADIGAFGVVLYEMLTGRTMFAGETASETMAQVMMKEPDWDVLPQDTPQRLRHLLLRCLVKDPRNRARDIGDVRIAIDEMIASPEAIPDNEPVWSPDGLTVRSLPAARAQETCTAGLRTAPPRKNSSTRIAQVNAHSVFRRTVNFYFIDAVSAETRRDVWVLAMTPEKPDATLKSFPFLKTPFNEIYPHFSPDGHWGRLRV